jgi:hypothetical protein
MGMLGDKMQNKMKNKIILTAIFLIFLVGLISNAAALGITPGRSTLNYNSGTQKEVEITIFNSEHKNMKISLEVEGELKNYVSLSENSAEFSSADESKTFKYVIKFPESLAESPGLHTSEIIATETSSGAGSGTRVGATVAVVSQIYVYVLCSGKCIETDLSVDNVEQNGTADFIVPVINRGKLKIENAKAVIDIYSGDIMVATLETNSASIESQSRTELTGSWLANVSEGDYTAKISVIYDGANKDFEKIFSVGKQTLTIDDVYVNNFRLGEIAKLMIMINNKWNREISDVYANLVVYDGDNQVMANVKSSSENIPAMTKKELVAYWDTAGIREGQYDGKLMVVYDKKSTDRKLMLKISQNSLDISGVGYAITAGGGGGLSLTTILIILVVVLLAGNLAWFVFFRKRFGKKKESEKKDREGIIKVK